MARRSLGVRLDAWLAIAACAQACAQPPQQSTPIGAASDCTARVVVTFRGPVESNAIAALADAHSLTLSVVNRLLPDLYVLDLGARGGESACAAALERLRADARVRSAELDARRAPHG